MIRSRPRHWQIGLSLLILAAALAAVIRPASAHAFVLKTDPADNAELDQAPGQVRLWFSEGILLDATRASLVDSRGSSFPVKIAGLEKDPGTDESLILVIDLPRLAPGVYNLSWQTVSSDDLHPTADALVFGVQQTPLVPARDQHADSAPGTNEIILHWLSLAGMAGMAGALAFVLLMGGLRQEGALHLPALRRRLLRLALQAGLLSLAAGVGLLLIQQAFIPGQAFPSGQRAYLLILSTHYGRYWLASQGLLAGLILMLLVMLRFADPPSRAARLLPLAGTAVVALHVIAALSSHPITVLGFSLPHLIIHTTHLLAASLWAGGLLVLVVVVLPLLRRAPSERGLGLALLRRFGGLAAASVAALAITGLYLSGQLVASPDALLTTRYGWTLIFKILLGLGVGVFGLLNSASLHPQVAGPLRRLLHRPDNWKPFQLQSLARTIFLETGLAGLVLILAASLGSTQPARGPQFDPPPAASAITAEASTQVNDLVVSLSVKPNRPGQNFVNLGVFNTRRPAPAPISQVLVRFGPPDSAAKGLNVVADALGSGHYQVSGSALDAAGQWKISVQIQRPGLPDASLEIPWTVQPALVQAAQRPVLISNRPLAPVTSALSAALFLTVLLAVLIRQLIWYRRRSSPAAQAPSLE